VGPDLVRPNSTERLKAKRCALRRPTRGSRLIQTATVAASAFFRAGKSESAMTGLGRYRQKPIAKRQSESLELHLSPHASSRFSSTCEIELPSGKAHCGGLQTVFAPIFSIKCTIRKLVGPLTIELERQTPIFMDIRSIRYSRLPRKLPRRVGAWICPELSLRQDRAYQVPRPAPWRTR
jgi:hypothetical protein